MSPASLSSSSEGTRAPSGYTTPGLEKKHSNPQSLPQDLTNPNPGVITPVVTRHEELDFFDKEGHVELSRRLSRTATLHSVQTRGTQDPTNEDFDYKSHLLHLFRKSEKEGVLKRELGVCFEDVNVTGDGSGLAYGPSVGELLTGITRLSAKLKSIRHPTKKPILTGFSGTVKPKEMLLVLGRPGSGCSTLLKILSNNTESYAGVDGLISYDGATPKMMQDKHQGDIAYLPEDDRHLPNLTVGQTLNFAAATRTPASHARVGTREESITDTRDVLVSLFGLRHTLNTKVGNDIIRGVSGGERKRVSIAELMTTGAKIACHDNSTRGLDASTALEYTRALRIATDVTHLTTILSIYQCGEQIFTLFDKVCVIYEGHMAYFGPMGEAVEYFIEMGYQPQNRQTSADFLVAVTDPKGRFVRSGFEGKVPKTAQEFARHFRESPLGQRNLAEVTQAKDEASHGEDKMKRFEQSAKAERAKHQSPYSKYLINYGMQVRLCMTRRVQMQMGELPTLIVTIVAAMFQALIIGSVFFQMPKSTAGFFSRGGVIFFAILYNSFTGMAEITTSYGQRPIVVRQRQYAMVRPSADILALNVVDMVPKFLNVFFFDLILYFMSGLQISASQFFVFILFTYITTLSMISVFRALASSNRFEPNATMMAGILILVVAIYAGYAIPRPSMKVWFRWLSYAQPISFGFEALLSNEFRTLTVPCSQLVPSGPGYENVSLVNQVCAVAGSVPGQLNVDGSNYLLISFGYTWKHAWRNLGIILGYMMFFLTINLVTTEIQRDESAAGGVMVFKRGKTTEKLIETIEAKVGDDAESGGGAPQLALVSEAKEAPESAADNLQSSNDIFTWTDVCYDVQIKGKTRRLLNNVSGFVVPGKMTALMGESGAGKTTLLNVLAQRVTTGVVHGDMFVNGKPLPTSFQRQTGYCQQQDTHMATCTVREALTFSALLRQPARTPKSEKLDYVEEIIKLLEMESYAEAIVGEVGMGLNVEQRKRLTIAVELAAKPALLIFLDEPSSGLDSQSSWSILQLLRKLADHGQAILATIHQPSSELFQVFDRLLLLKKGGETVYFGDLGPNSKTLINYFGERSDLKCGEKDNPAEYILEAIGAGASATAKQDWHQLWKESKEFQTVQTQIHEYHSKYAKRESAADADEDSGRGYAAHTVEQFKVVTTRVFQHYWRDPTYAMSKVMLNAVAGLFIGFSFWMSPNNVAGLQNKLFAVFMIVVLASPLAQQLQPKWIGLRTLYTARESPSRMYSWPVLVIANVLVEIPWNIFAGTILFVCWYWTVGFPSTSDRAGYAYLMYMLFEIYFASFAQCVAAMSANGTIASILFATFFSFVVIFNGVVQPVGQLPKFWSSWMYHLSPFTYIIEGLVANAISGSVIECGADEYNIVVPPFGQDCLTYLQPFTSSASTTGYARDLNGQCGYCQYATGDQFLAGVGMSFSHRYRDVGFIIAYIIFNIAATFLFTYLFTVADFGSIHWFQKAKDKVAVTTSDSNEKTSSSSASSSDTSPTATPADVKVLSEGGVESRKEGGHISNV